MGNTLHSVCDKKIFEKVFYDYSKEVRNFIYFKCGNGDQADDLTQDAFAKLWRNCKKVPFDKVKPYLFTLVKNDFFKQVAHQKVVLKYQKAQTEKHNIENPEFLLREKEFKNELNQAIALLTEQQREVFLLNRIEKKKYAEIATMLDISIKTVEKRMHGALKHLRTTIKNYKF